MEIKQYYLLAINLNMTVIWGYLKFCWFMLDFHKYECYNFTPCYNLPRSSLPFVLHDTLSTLAEH